MEAYHNSRDTRYRWPFGAVAPDTDVTLTLDVREASSARVLLRTWTDAKGEEIREMNLTEGADLPKDTARYQITFSPDVEGITWYHFIIVDAQGIERRYGAQAGQTGGSGQLLDWEPPSFQLSAFGPRLTPPAWYEAIDGYVHDEAAGHTLEDIIDTLIENYPFEPFRTELPWMRETSEPGVPIEPARFIVNDDVFGFWRQNESDEILCILINASWKHAHDVVVPMVDEAVTELLTGYCPEILKAGEAAEFDVAPRDNLPSSNTPIQEEHFAFVQLAPFAAAILHFHAHMRLQRPLEPGQGVLAHITSLPTGNNCESLDISTTHRAFGTLGSPAHVFIDWLADAGARYWQVLPVNPTDEFGSPYAGISAFAGNARLVEGASTDSATQLAASNNADYRAFCEREADWLEPYACFMACRHSIGEGVAWQEWPEKFRHFNPALIEGDPNLAQLAEECRCEQYAFERQWCELRKYTNERGIQIIGDMPIYVSADSADVWAHPEIFQLDSAGNPESVAGCPPDAFAAEGQLWGNPLYNWNVLRERGYDWWLRRLERAFSLYDWVRLDHFIGFARYFSVPAGKTARDGVYQPGPGVELFRLAREKFGPLPLIAEDLGLLTPGIRALGASCGFPGMDILQFADSDPLWGYTPRPEKIAYTGTHDNQTLVGFCKDRYPQLNAYETAEKLMQEVATCDAPVRIFPLQDLLGLDDEARMNVPGVAEDNWQWQACELPKSLTPSLRECQI